MIKPDRTLAIKAGDGFIILNRFGDTVKVKINDNTVCESLNLDDLKTFISDETIKRNYAK